MSNPNTEQDNKENKYCLLLPFILDICSTRVVFQQRRPCTTVVCVPLKRSRLYISVGAQSTLGGVG